jgi:hypothetical protein
MLYFLVAAFLGLAVLGAIKVNDWADLAED